MIYKEMTPVDCRRIGQLVTVKPCKSGRLTPGTSSTWIPRLTFPSDDKFNTTFNLIQAADCLSRVARRTGLPSRVSATVNRASVPGSGTGTPVSTPTMSGPLNWASL